jgi:trigger factor|tara:strand:+ start:4314 stop:5654 length:1341 start_codon:yes stop_codon:yes gene_type:complete
VKITNKKTERSQAFLTIEMEPAEVEESLEQAYQRLVTQADIPGFRKGKAPRPILERHVGRGYLLENALDSLVPQTFKKVLKEQGIEAIAQPRIEVTQTEPVVFKAIVPLKPTVKLGDYRHLKIKPPSTEKVTKDQIDTIIEELRHRHANWEPVDRSADFDDFLIIDAKSTAEGKTLSHQKNLAYQLRHDSTLPVPGFAEQLVGMQRDEVKEFKLQVPSDYPQSDLAGKEISFEVKVSDVNKETRPKLDNQFAGIVDPQFKTLAALRQNIESGLKQHAKEYAAQKFEEKVLEATVSMSKVEFPEILVEDEIDQILSQRFSQSQNQEEELESYLKSINKTPEEFHQGLHDLSTKRITQSLVLRKVAEEEKIEVSNAEIDTEIDTEIENMTENASGENKEETKKILNSLHNREAIKNRVLTQKTLQRLSEIANGATKTKAAKKKEEKKK